MNQSPTPTQISPTPKPVEKTVIEATMSPTPGQVKESPIVEPPHPLTFYKALKRMMDDGARVTKLEWANVGYYAEVKDGILKLHKPNDTWHNWILSDGDITGEDYVVINK